MLPLLLTFLGTLYLYAPGLVFRWAVGLAVGRENLKQPPSKVEETTQALVWVALPLGVTVLWVWVGHVLRGQGALGSMETIFSGLYSEATYRASPQQFYANVGRFLRANGAVLWRLYLLIGLYSALTFTVLRRSRDLHGKQWGKSLVRFVLVTSPPFAEWFIWLSGLFVPRSQDIHADVLTRTGGLYQGKVSGYALEPSGALRTLTLDAPRRFSRDAYLEAQKQDASVRPDTFWRDIPGNLFVILGPDIANVNVRYARRKRVLASLRSLDPEVLRQLLRSLEEAQSSEVEQTWEE